MTARASNGVWIPVGLHGQEVWRAEARNCLKSFVGPEGIRTLDLFHAMEGRGDSETSRAAHGGT